MLYQLRLTLGLSFAILIVVLISGSAVSHQMRADLQRQIVALQLDAHSQLEYDAIREAGAQLIEPAPWAIQGSDSTHRAGSEASAAHALTIAADLRRQTGSQSAADLSSALIALAQAARPDATGAQDSARLTRAQTEFSQALEAYGSAQSSARSSLSPAAFAGGQAELYGLLALAATCLTVGGLLYSFSRALIIPLRTIGAALEAVGHGDLEHTLPGRMPAEFAPIVNGYQAMRQILSDRQQALNIQLRRTSLLTQISIELRGTLDPQTIIERVLRILGTSLGIDDATILLTLPHGAGRLGMRWADRRLQRLSDQQIALMLEHGLEGRVQQEQSNIVLGDVSHIESWHAGGGRPEGSAMVLVLAQDELTLGSLSVYKRHNNAFSNYDLLLLEGIVAQTSGALCLGLRFQAERRHSEQLEELVSRRTIELQRSRDLLRVVFDHLPEGLILLSQTGRILAANNAFCRNIIGRTPQVTVGKQYLTVWKELAAEAELTLTAQGPSESGVPIMPPERGPFPIVAASWRILSSDIVGQQRWYAVDRFPIAGKPGTSEQCLERWRDITQHEELQRRLLIHEQLSSLGRLAAGIAHEVGNPLQSALGCLELCREDGGMSTLSREYLDLALGELDRMARTMASLRNLYRPPQITWEQVNLNQLITQVGQFTRRQLERARVRTILQLDSELPPVTGQPDALRQVLLNLVLNAQQAMNEGGEIRITTARKFTDRSCQITIHDTGVGMSADQIAHLFEPFRSLNAQGVGLGLYLSRQIIEQHTGHIEIASQPGQGTTITIQIPWIDAGPWRPQPEQALSDA